MSTPSFDPQPCCGGAPGVVQQVEITDQPIDVNVLNTVAIAEPVDVNVLGTVPVSGSVGITGQPISTNATIVGTVPVSITGQPIGVSGTVAVSSVAGTVTVGGTVAVSSVAGTVTTAPAGSTTASTTLTTATAVSNGTTVDFANAKKNVTLFALVNGTVTSGVVDLQASQDGANWVRLASTGNLATGVNQYLTLDGGAFRYFRGTVSEVVVGGGSVTATLMYA